MRWWDRLLLHRAARRYARELGPWLAASYGASDTYMPAQVGAGLARLDLPTEYGCLGYAAFLTEAEFGRRVSGSSAPTYAEARAILQRHRRRRSPASGGDFYESGIGLYGGGFGGQP
jgi:hypothetical protein